MNEIFACPYCKAIKGAKSSRNKNNFTNWLSIKGHINSCKLNNHEYYLSTLYGPIHYSEFCDTNSDKIRIKYPGLKNIFTIKKDFKSRNIDINYLGRNSWTKLTILQTIVEFKRNHNRIPSIVEFENIENYPKLATICRYFGSWNNAIEEAGFELNTYSGFGIKTVAKDNILYRSKAEAYFVDNFLYNQYKYIYEIKYTDGSNKLYDFYLPELDLYIELTGGLKSKVIEEKIVINKQQNKKLLVLYIDDMYKIKTTQGWVAESVLSQPPAKGSNL